MIDQRDSSTEEPHAALRRQAEQSVETRPSDAKVQDPRVLLHELQVHQVELEMQNDALRMTQAELQTALARSSNLFDFAPIPYLTADRQGHIVQANHAAGRLFCEPRGILCRLSLSGFISEDYLHPFETLLEKAFDCSEHHSCEIKLRIAGKSVWVVLKLLSEPDSTVCLIALEDVTEKKSLEQQLADRVHELERADRHKTEFLATLAHELRNPMSPLLMISELLKNNTVEPDRLSWALDMIHRQINHLARLVDDLLDVSRISRGQINLQCEVVNLSGLLREALEMCQPLIDAEHHQLSVRIPAEPVEVMADPVRLVQVVSNLLNNAVKFTAPGGLIELTLETRHGQAIISVKDNGLGIETSLLSHIFEQFGQVDSSAHKASGGLGVGLYLSRALVDLHGGVIDVSSAGLGKGAEFIVRLPLREGSSNAAQENAGTVPQSPISAKRILIVDDNRDAAYGLKLLLCDRGHDVRVAHEGYAALEMAKGFCPELVLLDIGMPGMDGFEVCRRIRSEVWGKDLLVVALSGWGVQELGGQLTEACFSHHLTKPAHLADIEALLQPLSIRAAASP
jgi:PAS domain S-box-containing protein